MGVAQWIVIAFVLLRTLELFHSKRNTKTLLANGGKEYGRRQYPLFILLHVGWLVAIYVTIPSTTFIFIPGIFILGILLLLRIWVITTLGPFWTTRVISASKFPLIIKGPYKWIKHPNYCIVALEIILLPAIFGAWEIAIIFGLLNGILLYYRIRIEDDALNQRRVKPKPEYLGSEKLSNDSNQ